jgi:hypothetical protein
MDKFFRAVSALNDWDTLLRTIGILTLQFNPERDVMERKYHLVGVTLDGKDIPLSRGSPVSRLLAKQREAIEVSRPGVRMEFDNLLDFKRRMDRLADHEGHDIAPDAPWIVTNKTTGVHKLIPANWPSNCKAMRLGKPRVPCVYDAVAA